VLQRYRRLQPVRSSRTRWIGSEIPSSPIAACYLPRRRQHVRITCRHASSRHSQLDVLPSSLLPLTPVVAHMVNLRAVLLSTSAQGGPAVTISPEYRFCLTRQFSSLRRVSNLSTISKTLERFALTGSTVILITRRVFLNTSLSADREGRSTDKALQYGLTTADVWIGHVYRRLSILSVTIERL